MPPARSCHNAGRARIGGRRGAARAECGLRGAIGPLLTRPVFAPLLAAALAPVSALRATRANPPVARVQLAFLLTMLANGAYVVAVAVYAYRQDGAAAVALAVVVRTVPSAFAGPALGALADRRSRAGVLRGASLATAAAMIASAAVVASGGPAAAVYGLGLVVTVAGMAFRTAQSAVLPSLTTDPHELTSANVLTSALEGAGVFAGPALGALALGLGGPAAAFAAAAVVLVAGAVALTGVVSPPPTRARTREEGDHGHSGLARDQTVRLVLGLLLAQTFVSGALTVLYAVCALELLDLGEPGVGLLTAAYGLGGVLGSLATFALAGSRRLVAVMTAGLVLWGLPLVAIGLTASVGPALVLLAVVGVGNVLFDVATVTLLQRAVPDELLARAFGALETVCVLGLGTGALIAPVLTARAGPETALVAFGALLPLLAIASRGSLRAVDRRARVPGFELDVLRSLPLLAGLAGPVLENLAFRAERVDVPAGRRLLTQGEGGDRFYAIASGALRVTVDSEEVAVRGPGEGVGEIALLRDIPRIASVDVVQDAVLVSLDRRSFLAAVTGDMGALATANDLVAERMHGGLRVPRL